MDSARGFEPDRGGNDGDVGDADDAIGAVEARRMVGGDERRMHVRAYNHWVSLLDGRPYPSIADLDPAGIVDFGAHSVLLDFSYGADDPRIAYLGRALREECGLDADVARIAEVPSRSLLSRLTDHYLQIIANRAPVGFEAEFVGTRGTTMLYRGILMPFSSDGEGIDYVYGVINWKEVLGGSAATALADALGDALKSAPAPVAPASAWADGPGVAAASGADAGGDSAVDRLAIARAAAAALAEVDGRSREALYAALGRAHAFAGAALADPAVLGELAGDAGIKVQARAPFTAVAKLVFGAGADKARLTEFAAVLSHAARVGVPEAALPAYLAATDGGMKAVVALERAHRRGTPVATPGDAPDPLADRAALARFDWAGATPGYRLLLARIGVDTGEVLADVTEPGALARALRRAA